MGQGDEVSFELPSNDPVAGSDGKFTRTWSQWLSWAHVSLSSIRQSGPTSERPTSVLWIGRQYFDTTLNKPVYLSAVNPNVWRDASGAPV